MAIQGFPRQLTLANFKPLDVAPPSPNQRQGYQLRAETSVIVDYAVTTHSQSKKDGDNIVTTWRVDRNYNPKVVLQADTWMLKSVRDNKADGAECLAHEQGHYDIAGLCARTYRRRVLELEADTEKNLNTQIAELRTEISAKIDRLNQEYDDQTSIKGTRDEQILRQQVWLTAIRNCKGDAVCDFDTPN